MLRAIIKKELLLVRRDLHALLVLFVMPMVFILIMSLSLQDFMNENRASHPKLGLWFEDPGQMDSTLGKSLKEPAGFDIIVYKFRQEMLKSAKNDHIKAAIVLPKAFISTVNKSKKRSSRSRLQLYLAPSTSPQLGTLAEAVVTKILVTYRLKQIFSTISTNPYMRRAVDDALAGGRLIEKRELYTQETGLEKERPVRPNSVQQSVPAWLVFSMFFVVIPIATTFLVEKQQGTLQRLRTFPVPGSYLLVGKLVPYLGINLIQTLLMFLVGIYLVPMLGGQALTLPDKAWLLIPMSMMVSIAAISFALLIATRVKTTEQATTIGGISNILLAALGGIMVPLFVMPETMQTVARFSPMNWGLEGFLDILLRQGELQDILPEMGKLLLLALVLFGLAVYSYRTA